MKALCSLLLPLLALAAPPALAAEEPLAPFEAASPAATHPSLYSFADVYRLTVAREPLLGFDFAEPETPVRVAVAAPAAGAPELRFSVSAPRDDGRWGLLLAGLFTCAWVAHRRLTSPY
jgi:hypothetical protein